MLAQKPESSPEQAANEPVVSIVIVTRDRAAVLARCLEHVFAQTYGYLQVIVVDNSADRHSTEVIVSRFSQITYIPMDPQRANPSMMRNVGIAHSQGDILAFIDDDTLISTGWVKAVVSHMSMPNAGGIVGRVLEADAPEVSTTEIGRFSPRGEIVMNFNNTLREPVEVEFVYGCNMAVRRSALRIAGQYDPWLGFAYEEQDLSFRIRRAGFRLYFVPDMDATHLKAPRPSGVARRSENFDLSSLFRSSRSLTYLCVGFFGLRADFARVVFVNLPKGALRVFIDHPSVNNLLRAPAVVLGGLLGYSMAAARQLGFHRPPALARN